MAQPPVLIAGGGIAGLALGLTLHQIGVPFVIFESVRELKPLGVGINLQPNAVRELMDLGITQKDLDSAGLPVREWALVGQNGTDVYSEPRGTYAGYHWPQYAMHRGKLQMLLADVLMQRAGPNVLKLGARVTGYSQTDASSVTAHIEHADGRASMETGVLLIGADGIHSNVRAQMHPDQPPIHWGGALMWRGTTKAKPLRTESSFIGLGTLTQRMVIYPISAPDPDTGLSDINWIAEITVDDPTLQDQTKWFGEVAPSAFVHHFADWVYDWLDVPSLISGAEVAYENPMIDRDPVSTWVSGRVGLMGDAAHAMYPTGSNGASQAIVDARIIGARLVSHGIGPEALTAYDAELCTPISELVLRNRGAGPFGLLGLVDARCGGQFDNIDDVIPAQERADYMAAYKSAAGFARDTLNAAPPTLPQTAILQTS